MNPVFRNLQNANAFWAQVSSGGHGFSGGLSLTTLQPPHDAQQS